MSQHHGHNIRRSDAFLQKADAVASSESILRSNTAIQVITGVPHHRFHCDGAQTHREAQRADNTHAFRVRMQSASRSPLTSVRKPAKSEFPEYLLWGILGRVIRCAACTQPNGKRGRARLPFDAGRDRPTTLAGYRESTTQIMMSKVDRTNALYYVVNVQNIRDGALVPNVAYSAPIP